MDTLRLAEIANAFAPWFNRLANVLVRVIPATTQDWINVRNDIYNTEVRGAVPPAPLAATVTDSLLRAGSPEYHNYQAGLIPLPPAIPPPDFMAYFTPQVPIDLSNFDIPVFYHRVGTTDILDSMGNVIGIPAQVMVNGIGGPPAALANTNVGRATFFAVAPTAPNVQVGQVGALNTPAFAATSLQ
jgi:hypothetical protein